MDYPAILELAIEKMHKSTGSHHLMISRGDMDQMISSRRINGVNQILVSNPAIRVTVSPELQDGKVEVVVGQSER